MMVRLLTGAPMISGLSDVGTIFTAFRDLSEQVQLSYRRQEEGAARLRISAARLAVMTRDSSACHTLSPGRSTMSWMSAKLLLSAPSLAASWLRRASRSCLHTEQSMKRLYA